MYKLAREKYKLGREEYRLGLEKYKLGREEHRLGREKYKLGREEYRLGREKYKLGREEYRLGREKYKLAREKLRLRRDEARLLVCGLNAPFHRSGPCECQALSSGMSIVSQNEPRARNRKNELTAPPVTITTGVIGARQPSNKLGMEPRKKKQK